MKNNEIIYKVVGVDDLEGVIFCYCSTYEKAEKAARLLEANGFGGLIDIDSDIFIFDEVFIDGQRVKL